ncbi:hypothetical protein INT45_013743 [Circinella minor]|uniref:Uncharacterized protein n=1 Tax=Circinella minor TaxID=1195481 RepID=A0A8H7RHU8_9FUNG|nr:hypothetical protein INT45_013743 [Circinella minor]
MVAERKSTLDALARKLQEADAKAVLDRYFIDLKLCEDDWATNHMLGEGWNNRKTTEQVDHERSTTDQQDSMTPSSSLLSPDSNSMGPEEPRNVVSDRRNT